MAILLANSLRFDCTKVAADPLGRYIFLKGVLEGQMYTIGSIYAPNYLQLPFLEETAKVVSLSGGSCDLGR